MGSSFYQMSPDQSSRRSSQGSQEKIMDQKEAAELLLTYLYDCAEAQGHVHYFFLLNDFARNIGITTTEELIYLADALESHGFVMLSTPNPGEVSAMITVDGCSLVEEGGETGIITEYRTNPQAFGILPESAGDGSSADTKRIMLANSIYGILMDIGENIENNLSMEPEERGRFAKDLAFLTDRLGAQAVDRPFLDDLLERLSQVDGCSEMAGELSGLIRAYLG